MDFRAAVVNNMNTNMNSYFHLPRMNGPVHINAQIGNRNPSGETTTRRRRRRRHNGTKVAAETSIEDECVLQEHTPPYTPLRAEFGEVPTLQVLQASPVADVTWPPAVTPQRVPVETLKAIAERARERLAIRIQAYYEEQQNVAQAASNIQKAYATHMESQLGTIITNMQGHLSTAIDTKLDSFKQAWKEEVSGTLGDLEVYLPSRNLHSVDPKLVKTARISALESETQKLMEMISIKEEVPTEVPNSDMLVVLKQLQVQGERTSQSLKELYSISKQHALETKELRDAMKTAGLLPVNVGTPTPQKVKPYGEPGSAKGKYPFSFMEGKENSSSSIFGLSNSPMKTFQGAAGILESPQL